MDVLQVFISVGLCGDGFRALRDQWIATSEIIRYPNIGASTIRK